MKQQLQHNEYLYFEFSKHARKRQQKRSVPPEIIEALMDFGASFRQCGNTEVLYFSKKSLRDLKLIRGRRIYREFYSRYKNAYAVLDSKLQIITCGWRNGKLKLH